ncbi:MAG: hypothetical protein CSA62_13355 [Planctomycetota bacterium]|nr:MAG: hypothetical protein CSA62_13355 [Planctomycetota bacterium]
MILTSLFVAFLLGGTYYALTRSGFTRTLVIDLLAKVLRGVEIESATMDPFGGTVRIEDVRVRGKPSDGDTTKEAHDVLRAEQVVVGVSMNPLTGVGELRTVTIERPVLDLRLGENEAIDLSSLLAQTGQDPKKLDAETFPSLEIRDMTLRLHLTDKDPNPLIIKGIQLKVQREEGDNRRVAIIGQAKNPFGGTIRIRGSGDIEHEEFRLLSEGEAFHVGRKQLSRFGSKVLAFVDKHQISGRIKPTIWMSYPSASGGIAVGAHAQFEQMSFLPPAYRFKLEQMRGRAALSPDNGGTLILEASRDGTDGKLAGRLKMIKLDAEMEFELNVQGEQLLLTPAYREAMNPELPHISRIWDAFEPDQGRFDLKMYLFAGAGVPHADEIIELDIGLAGLSARYLGLPPSGAGERGLSFPLALEDLAAQLKLREGRLTVTELHARGPKGGRISGNIDMDLDSNQIDVELNGTSLASSANFRHAFGKAVPGGTKIWDQFQPQGRFDVDFRGRIAPQPQGFDFIAKVRPDAARAQWTRFPVPLEQVTGEIVARPESIDFALGALRKPESPIKLRGHVDLSHQEQGETDTAELPWEVHVTAKDLDLDLELRDALATLKPPLRKRWEMFMPEGRCDVDFLAWKASAENLDFDLRADLKNVSARFSAFPAPMHNIDGPIMLQGTPEGTRVDVLGLRGTSLGARLLFHGSLFTPIGREEELPLTDLTTIAQGAVLADELGELLIAQKMTTQRLWEMAEASGRIDAVHRVRRVEANKQFEQELELDLRKVRVDARILPDSLTGISGKVRIDKNRIAHLDLLRGFLGESEVRCYNGRIEHGPEDTRIQLTLAANDYPVDQRLARLLDGRPKQSYLALNAIGRIGFEGLSLRMRIPHEPPAGVEGLGLQVWVDDANVLLRDLSFDAGVAFSGMRGSVQLTKGQFGPDGALFQGKFSKIAFDTLGQTFEDAQGDFKMTDLGFEIPRGRVRLHRGSLGGFGIPGPDGTPPPIFRYQFEKQDAEGQRVSPPKVFANFDFQNLSISSLVEKYDLSYRYRGRVGGRLALEMQPEDRTSLMLRGKLGIDDAELGSVPIFQSIYAFLQPERRPRFDNLALAFETKDRAFQVKHFRMGSPLIKIDGRGQISYDGYVRLQLDFPDLFPEADSAFILPGIYKVLSNALLSFDIYGYFGMTRTGPRFLLEGKPKNAPLGPLPVKAPRIPEIYK